MNSLFLKNSQQSTKLETIQFFNHSSDCISHFTKTPWHGKAIYFLHSCLRHLFFLFSRAVLIAKNAESQMKIFSKIDEQSTKNRLAVCIHGLNGNTYEFKKIYESMSGRLDHTDVYMPRVKEKGNAKLDELSAPILEEIVKWGQGPGERELVLIGVSNGARISRAVEASLSKSKNLGNIKKLKVISIVGANKGSSTANLAHRLGLSWLLSKNIAEEMPVNSKRCKQLTSDWEEGIKDSPELIRDYTFIASPHDWMVPGYKSTLPSVLNQNARYAILPGYGHNSIVDAASKTVADIILENSK